MKKIISMLCVVAILATMFALPAFAADTATVEVTGVSAEATVEPRAATYYKTNCSCNLRANAGIGYASYCVLPEGQLVVLQGYKTGTDGKQWLYVSVSGGTYSGYYGYIRSDLLDYYYWG